MKNETFDNIETIARNLGHELRSPLIAIKAGVGGVKDYIPLLVEAYCKARNYQIDIPMIQQQHLEQLIKALELAEHAAQTISAYVNMFVTNMTPSAHLNLLNEKCSIIDCLIQSAEVFPYKSPLHRDLILSAFSKKNDFFFYGNKSFVINMVLNFYRNAIYNIESMRNGRVSIDFEKEEEYHCLLIRYPFANLTEDMVNNAFTNPNFFKHDLGGLQFSKKVMQSLQGEILCHQIDANHVEFKLKFPNI